MGVKTESSLTTFVISVDIGARLHHTQHSPANRKRKVMPGSCVRLMARKMKTAAGRVNRAGTMKKADLMPGVASARVLTFDPSTVPTMPPTAVMRPTARPACARFTPSYRMR